MKLKRNPLFAWLIPLALLAGCGDDSPEWPTVDGKAPEMNLVTEITASPGTTFHVTGVIKDADGISSIHLDCPGLDLKKTIDIIEIYEKPLAEYNLDYAVKVSPNEVADSFGITVTATDVAGKSTEGHVGVRIQ